MTTFAKLQDGRAYQPVIGATIDDALAGKFAPAWVVQNKPLYLQVPDTDTNGNILAHGAKDNGDGTYTNPVVAAPTPKPTILTDKQFRKHAATALGSNAAVGAIWKAANDSADPNVKFALMAWTKADTFDKSEVSGLSALLVAGGCMTAEQRTDLLTGWPEA